jgi:hypothetical protein
MPTSFYHCQIHNSNVVVQRTKQGIGLDSDHLLPATNRSAAATNRSTATTNPNTTAAALKLFIL